MSSVMGAKKIFDPYATPTPLFLSKSKKNYKKNIIKNGTVQKKEKNEAEENINQNALSRKFCKDTQLYCSTYNSYFLSNGTYLFNILKKRRALRARP